LPTYQQAGEAARRVLVGSGRYLGRSHPNTLTYGNNLKLTLHESGKYDEAEEAGLAGSHLARVRAWAESSSYTVDCE